jgi:PRA1 family protein
MVEPPPPCSEIDSTPMGGILYAKDIGLREIKPWREFADTSKLHVPKSASAIQGRIIGNLTRYKWNYMAFVVIILILSMCVAVGIACRS